MTLTEFLLARIAEDEAEARERQEIDERRWAEIRDAGAMPAVVVLRTAEPEFTLAECAAKRRLIEWGSEREQVYIGVWGEDPESPRPESFVPGALKVSPHELYTLRFLALPYADHPDYLEDWRP